MEKTYKITVDEKHERFFMDMIRPFVNKVELVKECSCEVCTCKEES
jgi:hypothetical protein